MALSTYTELQAAIAALLRRTDLTSAIPDFITLAEANLNRDLHVRQMFEVDATFAIASGTATATLPTDFAGVKSFRLNTSPVTAIEQVSLDAQDDIWHAAYSTTGRPKYFSVTATQFLFAPTPDAAYTATLRYRKRIPALVSNSTNWLLTAHPDAYLYGAAAASAPYLQEDPRLGTWAALYRNAVDAINRDGLAQMQGPTMTPFVATVV